MSVAAIQPEGMKAPRDIEQGDRLLILRAFKEDVPFGQRCCDARGLCSPRKPSHGLTPSFSSLNRIDIERFVQDDSFAVVVGDEFGKYVLPANGDDLEPSGRRSMQARPFCPRQSLVGHLP